MTLYTGNSATTYLLSFLISLPLFAACSGTESVRQPDSQQMSLAELEELHWSRIDSSRMDFTQADVDFMSGMIVHHAQALIMSRLAPENDAGPAVQRLAARIINAQDDEIATMQKWLRDRNQPVPVIHIDGLNMMVHMKQPEDSNHDMTASGEMDHGEMNHNGMDHHHDMPGMLSQDQLEELASATGTHFDRLFLTYMIDHHEGAVYMVNELFDSDGAANDVEAYELASEINAEQITEIERMHLMLENMTY